MLKPLTLWGIFNTHSAMAVKARGIIYYYLKRFFLKNCVWVQVLTVWKVLDTLEVELPVVCAENGVWVLCRNSSQSKGPVSGDLSWLTNDPLVCRTNAPEQNQLSTPEVIETRQSLAERQLSLPSSHYYDFLKCFFFIVVGKFSFTPNLYRSF